MLISAKSIKLPLGTNNVAEVLGLLLGLQMALKLNCLKHHVEGDYQVIINACRDRKYCSWKIKYFLV